MSSASTIQPPETRPIRKHQKRTVMICDDEQDVLSIYQAALCKSYHVITASSGQECLVKYSEEVQAENKIDVILLDFRLGDATGDKIAYKIKNINATKVVLITAYELEKELLARLEDGKCIVSHIRKPISPKVLLDKVAQIIDTENVMASSYTTEGEGQRIAAVEAMIAAVDKHLGKSTSNLVLKTLKLVYNIDENSIRAQPELFETMLVKILGRDSVRVILRDACWTNNLGHGRC